MSTTEENWIIAGTHRCAVGGVEIDGSQAAATREGVVTDAEHRVGDDDGGQATATREGVVANANHCTGNNTVYILYCMFHSSPSYLHEIFLYSHHSSYCNYSIYPIWGLMYFSL